MRYGLSLAAVALFAASSFAAINIKICTEDQFLSAAGPGCNGSDSNALCQSFGALYRYSGYKAVRDGVFPSYSGCVPMIDFAKNTQPFTCGVVEPASGPAVISGKADKFIVPTDGVYEFFVRFNELIYIIIDGKLLNMATKSSDTAALKYTRFDSRVYEVIGTVEAAGGTHCHTVGVNLTAGEHTFEFYYVTYGENAMAMVSWKKPGDADFVYIPEEAFGGNPNNCCGTKAKNSIVRASIAQPSISVEGSIISATDSRIVKAIVYDIRGRSVGSYDLTKGSASINNLSGSSYLVRGFDAKGKVLGSTNLVK